MHEDAKYLQERAILALKNDIVSRVNEHAMELIPGEKKIYYSSDVPCKESRSNMDEDILYPSEFLNSLTFSGVPYYSLTLKTGMPVMLLRNLNQSEGLCNGTRLIIIHMGNWHVQAKIICGANIGKTVFIPCVIMTPSESNVGFRNEEEATTPIYLFYYEN